MSVKQIVMAAAGASAPANYIEDVFSTFLYTGNGSTQTITNDIDLAGKGGLVWTKNRLSSDSHQLYDTARGRRNYISSDTSSAEFDSGANTLTYLSNGFGVTAYRNVSSVSYASWTFRKQAKFFDVVTYTGNGANNREISHSLGVAPGMIIVKVLSQINNWAVWHRSLSDGYQLYLDRTEAAQTGGNFAANSFQTSSSFKLSDPSLNSSGDTYVAYLFAHDAGGFGLTGADNVISCGSFTTDGSGNATVTLGWEPQWVMIKNATGSGSWQMTDNMRGLTVDGSATLYANGASAEQTASSAGPLSINATGFSTLSANVFPSSAYIYIAIRRGPMRVPTDGTKVFGVAARTGTGFSNAQGSTFSFPADMLIVGNRDGTDSRSQTVFSRLLGGDRHLVTSNENSESLFSTYMTFDRPQNGRIFFNAVDNNYNGWGVQYIDWAFRRAPWFFDEVAYVGNGGSARAIDHNLKRTPELIIVKGRNSASYWGVFSATLGNQGLLKLNTNDSNLGPGGYWDANPTGSVFYVSSIGQLNQPGINFVARLFASCPGVSKVGSYSGTGTTLQIDCGFTGGARFVLIKRVNAGSTGDWYVWDVARGLVSTNDPFLLMNSTAAEVANTDYIDPYSLGFEISSTAPADINANGGTFIYLAIA